jgi:FixJ family two-component response regulator
MGRLVAGKSNKNIAFDLGISQKTVDFHRANILEKTGVSSVVELVRLTQRIATGQP